MDDLTRNARNPADEDPVVHTYLATLPHLSPRPGIENRILTRVWLPRPRQLRRLLERAQSPAGERVIWLAVGTLAAGSLMMVSVVSTLIATYASQMGFGLSWLAENVSQPAWQGVRTVSSATGGLFPSGAALAVGIAVSVALFALCAWGLYLTVRQVTSAGVSFHGAR